MSADLPLTTHELAIIRARAQAVTTSPYPLERTVAVTVLAQEDVPRLVAEIERLRGELT